MRTSIAVLACLLTVSAGCSKKPVVESAQQSQVSFDEVIELDETYADVGSAGGRPRWSPAVPQAADPAGTRSSGAAADKALSPLPFAEPGPELRKVARSVLAHPKRAAGAEKLRQAGPPGLAALFEEAEKSNRLVEALDPLFDSVAGQRYARHAGLFWYTDLEQALAAARATRRPVLSLRLLGDLREDLSCANSRFFRVVLYPDPDVGRALREGFVLHWSSERPVPRVTVDYGDGRQLVRTITGNSVHYVMDARGRVVDAIPGLLDAAAFRRALLAGGRKATGLAGLSDEAFGSELARLHAVESAKVLESWRNDLRRVGIDVDPPPASAKSAGRSVVSAAEAGSMPMGKAMAEMPMVPIFVPVDPATRTEDATWTKLGALPAHRVALSAASRRVMRELGPRLLDAEGRPRALDDAAFAKLVAAFERTLAADSLRNQYAQMRRLHARFVERPLAPFVELNRWVYAELFLTPKSDPWLGLSAAGAFTALPEDGFVAARGP